MANYTVQKGDTLSAIGARLGVDWRSISGYRSGNPNLIYPGEVLTYGSSTPAPAPAPAAPAPAPAPKVDTVTPLMNELDAFDKNSKNPVDIYNAALERLGITDARTRVTALRQSLIDNQNLLDNLSGNISARTQNTLVTENQRQRLLAMEAEPIVGMGARLNQQFDAAQGDYKTITDEAKTTTGFEVEGQNSRRQALMDRLRIQIERTNDEEKKRQWQAEYDRQVALDKQNQANKDREFALAQQAAARSASSGGGGGRSSGGGGSSKPSVTQVRNNIVSMLEASKGADGKVSPKDWGVIAGYAYNNGITFGGNSGFANSYWKYANDSHWQDYQQGYEAYM